ncbi:MAG TPA: methyltransferase domain-containing protein [Anaerolineae bacterium]|jgi:ubiquinone/menaquinone biosynthesis C-methylase UbiE/uncharacterized protein YbaR (Trm112 family)|nr:methyltransferase domain-containing protein [Anaerolineae bacterium]
MKPVALALLLLAAGAGVAYWLVVLTEGAYLGSRAVRFLYDWGAASYDQVKQFDQVDDARALALPLVRELRGVERPLVLDVATGTGRLPLALSRNLEFRGGIFGLDISFRMLQQASRKSAQHEPGVMWLWKDGQQLPFVDGCLDAVTCLEALEFFSNSRRSLEEMSRVLREGGTMLISNRRGLDAMLMPGRAFSEEGLRGLLHELGFESVETRPWQTYYDLVWARKPGALSTRLDPPVMEDLLTCGECGESGLTLRSRGLVCARCSALYPITDGIVCMQERPKRWHNSPRPQ